MKNFNSLVLLLSLYSFDSSAWTLGNVDKRGFPISNIVIKISSNTCANAGFTASSMETLVNDAIHDYWSKVPTSSLELISGGLVIADLSADDLTAAVPKAAQNTIIVGCSANAASFPSGGILGVGNISCNASGCKGGVLLNDTAATQLDTLDRNIILTTFAHELGHALGLGHTSVQPALMYYSGTGKTQMSLSQDDIDGISYLYPAEKELGGLAGACGTIDLNGSSGGPGNFLGSLVVGLFLIGLINRIKVKSKEDDLAKLL